MKESSVPYHTVTQTLSTLVVSILWNFYKTDSYLVEMAYFLFPTPQTFNMPIGFKKRKLKMST